MPEFQILCARYKVDAMYFKFEKKIHVIRMCGVTRPEAVLRNPDEVTFTCIKCMCKQGSVKVCKSVEQK